MRIKEAKTCGAFAWSPIAEHRGYLAVGSIAGAMGDDFSADAHLEVRRVDLLDHSTSDMPVAGRVAIPDRVHKIDWSAHGGDHGLIAGGFVDGTVGVWSAAKVLALGPDGGVVAEGEPENPTVCLLRVHQGPVKGCQFNRIDPHFLATGGADKEVHIYSFENASTPQEVPAKPVLPAEVTDLRWNPHHKHIMGISTNSGVVQVWDLKAKRAALSIDVNRGVAANTLAWHPSVTTMVAIARDEPSSVVQLWDVRKAVQPVRELQGHTKGVLALAWCSDDPSMLISVGADGRTMCWNPNSGELFGELPAQDNWVYDVKWAPHYSAIVATASFDSSISVFSAQDIGVTTTGATVSRAAPKWLSRPCSASFGFGGRIAVVEKGGKTVKVLKTPAVEGSVSDRERAFCREIAANPVSTQQGVDWITAKGWGVVASVAAARVAQSKTPLLRALGSDPDAAVEKVASVPREPYSLGEDEFSEIVSQCVVAGKLTAAIDLCLLAGRFDDAFAIAYVAGDQQMKRVHAEFVARKSGNHRFAHYIGAVASGAYEQLAAEATTLPWKEILSLYAAFAPAQQFAANCNALGEALVAQGKNDEAADCFLFGSNVDRVSSLWKASGRYTAQQLVQVVTVLEQTLGRQCTDAKYAEVLAAYAETLAFDGEFQSSAAYAQRAAQLGCTAAATVANRVQAHMGHRSAPPFEVVPIADASTLECQMMGAQQTVLQRAPAATSPTPAAGGAPGNAARPAASPSPATHADPRAAMPAQNQNTGATAHPTRAPAPVTQPSHAAAGVPAGGMAGPTGGRAPAVGQTGSPNQPFSAASGPTPGTHSYPVATGGYPSPIPAGPTPAGPAVAPPAPTKPQPPPHAGQPPAPQPQPAASGQPMPISAPRSVQPTVVQAVPSAAPPPVRTSSSAALKESLADVNTSSVPAQLQPIVTIVTERVEKITDKRKKDTVEKSAIALFNKLNSNEIPESLAQLLLGYVTALGTPAAKEQWRTLSEKHWEAIQPFHNIKFLQ